MRSSNVRDDEVPDLMMDAMEDPMTASFYPRMYSSYYTGQNNTLV